jgi:hypothetical protein
MTKITYEKREAKLVEAIKEGIVVALHEQGKTYLRIAGIVNDTYNNVARIVVRDMELNKRFNTKISEQIKAAAQRISDNETYRAEVKKLADLATQEAPKGPIINQQAIDIFCKRMYAESMARLWDKITHNIPAHIFKYQSVVVGSKTTLEGKMFVLPKAIMPEKLIDTKESKRPYLALGYERGKLELCDENAEAYKAPMKCLTKSHLLARKAKKEIPALESLTQEQIRIICLAYFKRNGYNLQKSLSEQIRERSLAEIAPLAQKERTQLAGSSLYRKSSD